MNKIATKLLKTTGMLNKLKRFLPTNILTTLYNSLFLPHLNYGLLLWGYSPGRIIKIQKKVLRIISNEKYNAHTEPICKSFKVLKLEDLRTTLEYKFYF